MRIVSMALVIGGYVLVYAGIANHGRFAQHPWLGVWADAYAPNAKEATKTNAPAASTGTQTPGGITGRLFPPGTGHVFGPGK